MRVWLPMRPPGRWGLPPAGYPDSHHSRAKGISGCGRGRGMGRDRDGTGIKRREFGGYFRGLLVTGAGAAASHRVAVGSTFSPKGVQKCITAIHEGDSP